MTDIPADGKVYTKTSDGQIIQGVLTCDLCKEKLTEYVPMNGENFCKLCYEKFEVCGGCKKRIVANRDALKAVDKSWCKGCFVCHLCKKSLIGEKLLVVHDKVICPGCKPKFLQKDDVHDDDDVEYEL